MKIFITGCAKTGTTLLRRLFNYYDIDVFNYKELSIDNFIESNYSVSKRNFKTIFSNSLPQKEIERQLKLIKDNDIKIINITRKKEDILKKRVEVNVIEKRYDSCMEQKDVYKNYITYNLTYEELIKNPNKLQKEISKLLNIKINSKFSDYPIGMEELKEKKGKYDNDNYKLRKLGEKY